jgi:acyl-CoA reductase-like NAD-dependent aldehyde dehydrogenase
MSTIISYSPFDGSQVSEVPAATAEQITTAAARAERAWRPWFRQPVEQRSACLGRFADLIEQSAEELAALVTRETGKRLVEAAGEVAATAETARWYAEHPPLEEIVEGAIVRRRPLGVIAMITPWNVPMITPVYKYAPALMAGNAVLWKPSELSTAVTLRTAQLLYDAGLPEDVLHVLPGDGSVGAAIVADERVAGVHFTGSVPTGRAIAAAAGERLLSVALELGGSNPLIALADADLEAAAAAAVASAPGNNGQRCTATRRVVVDRSIADELESRMADLIGAVAPGDPLHPATAIGPLITPATASRFEQEVDRCRSAGARIVARGPAGPGLAAFRPTLIADLPAGDPFRARELFGPVVLLETVASDQEAVTVANDTPFGLSAAVHSRDPKRARAVADEIEAGVVGINRRTDALGIAPPFTGHKQSGNGVPEGGHYGYVGFTELQALYGTNLLAEGASGV